MSASIYARRTSGDAADTRTAGGKITRSRRPPPSSRTPYSRPTPPAEAEDDETRNPNWLSNLIYPAKVIASGAGKILSFFGNDPSSEDDDSENDAYDDELDEVETDASDKDLSLTNNIDKKRKIEQLIMEETFSREEGNQLIKLLKSRIVDSYGTLGLSTPPARTTAIMEARKWLQENRSGSKKKLEAELHLTSSQDIRSEKGSPADVAKSYMQSRPAWESPSFKQVDLGSPSTLGMVHFKEVTPKSSIRSSELKRSSFASGSWNLLEEIRRVRSKATEELLASAPLTKMSFSLFSSKNDPPQDILESKGGAEGAGPSDSAFVKSDNDLQDAEAKSFLRDSQEGDAVQTVDVQEHLEVADLNSNKDFEVSELRSIADVNGLCSSSGTVEIQDAAEKARPSKGENGNLGSSGQVEQDVHVDNSNLIPKATDAPNPNPSETVVNGSQNSSSMQEEDLSQEISQPIADGPTTKAKNAPKERKARVSTRRGRGRGK